MACSLSLLRERAGVRESVEQPLPDRSQYRLGLLQHLPIVETQHGEAGSFERPRSALIRVQSVSYTHLRAHETVLDLVCRLLLEKKKYNTRINTTASTSA